MANPGFINFSFPLRAYRRGFFEGNSTTISSVREDIKILLLTKKGERLINPSIGTNMSVFAGELFNQISPEEMKIRITSEIKDALATWMPHVTLTNITIQTTDDNPNLEDTHIAILMNYQLTNAEAATDSVQLTIRI